MKTQRGFTLIELLIAMAIVAVIGVLALTGLNTVMNQQEIATERGERWREVQRAMRIIAQDFTQVHPRLTRDESGTSMRASFLADPTQQFALEFSRGGWSNPTEFPRGTVLRVAYDLEEDTLVRFYWPVADRTFTTPPGRYDLLSGIQSMEIRYIEITEGEAETYLDWPPLDPSTGRQRLAGIPRAIEIEFVLEDLGTIWRYIEVRSG